MRFLSILICTALLVYLGHEAVTLHKLTVCRQEAWRSSLVLHTRAVLSESLPLEKATLPSCRILVSRRKRDVSWTRFPVLNRHKVTLNLRGKL